MALSLDASPPGIYRQRGTSSLQRLFRTHFLDLHARYEADFAKRLGRFRLERISSAVRRFMDCGDYTKGIARIRGRGTPWHLVLQSRMQSRLLPPLQLQSVLPLPLLFTEAHTPIRGGRDVLAFPGGEEAVSGEDPRQLLRGS